MPQRAPHILGERSRMPIVPRGKPRCRRPWRTSRRRLCADRTSDRSAAPL